MTDAAKAGDQVTINYVGRLEDGTVFDSTDNREPFQFEVGSQQVIPGMSNGVAGMQVGDEKTIEIPSAEAYGEPNEEMVIRMPVNRVPEDAKVGDALSDGTPTGQAWIVVERTEDEVVLDGNHPLAGKMLIFDVTLLAIG